MAIITWRQWVTNRARLRHELFDRRYAIYEQITGFIATVLQTGSVAASEEVDFLRQTKRAYFVFGYDEAVKELLDDIYKQTILLQALQAKENSLPPGKILDANIDKQGQVRQWFSTTLLNISLDRWLAFARSGRPT